MDATGDQLSLPIFGEGDTGRRTSRRELFAELLSEIESCTKCQLASRRKNAVPGEGSSDAQLVFVGEGPGADEDASGRPFVGRAGQLLDRILEAAGIERSQVYITNIVKCRPPNNRVPEPEEQKTCLSYLYRQLELIRPSLVVCLGATAAKALIEPNLSVTRSHGRWFQKEGLRIMPTYHPAALLRNPNYKKPTWQDFKEIKSRLNSLNAGKNTEQEDLS